MLLMKISDDEKEIREEIVKYYDEDTAEGMMQAVNRNGMSAWGALMVRKSNDKLLLLRLPGIQLEERKLTDA